MSIAKSKPRLTRESGSKTGDMLLAPPLIGSDTQSQTRVFISYRRQDTRAACDHLHASLAQRFGGKRVFRDLLTIKPGEDYPAIIDGAIKNTSVFIALIGRHWLTLKSKGRRRLDYKDDPVRLEIESALRSRVTVIPVLVDGAKMPGRKDLPASLVDLADRNAYELPWHQGMTKLQRRILQVEQERTIREAAERAELERLDLTAEFSKTGKYAFNVVISAMEMSLRKQGHKVSLNGDDLASSVELITGRPLKQGFVEQDLFYVIDMVGVKAIRSPRRYVARSYPLRSFDEVPAQLKLNRPILVGVSVYESWFREPSSKTGVIDLADSESMQGGIMAVLAAWDPAKGELKLRTPWPTWGKKGFAIMTRAIAERSIDMQNMRSIEPAPMSKPFSSLLPKIAAKLAAKIAEENDED
jgi:TIR domain